MLKSVEEYIGAHERQIRGLKSNVDLNSDRIGILEEYKAIDKKVWIAQRIFNAVVVGHMLISLFY